MAGDFRGLGGVGFRMVGAGAWEGLEGVQNRMGGAFGLLVGRTGGVSGDRDAFDDVAGGKNRVQKCWRAVGLRRVESGRSGGWGRGDLPPGAVCMEWWRHEWWASWMAERVESRLAAWSPRRNEEATSPDTWHKDRGCGEWGLALSSVFFWFFL